MKRLPIPISVENLGDNPRVCRAIGQQHIATVHEQH
jgi:hypothetical protein